MVVVVGYNKVCGRRRRRRCGLCLALRACVWLVVFVRVSVRYERTFGAARRIVRQLDSTTTTIRTVFSCARLSFGVELFLSIREFDVCCCCCCRRSTTAIGLANLACNLQCRTQQNSLCIFCPLRRLALRSASLARSASTTTTAASEPSSEAQWPLCQPGRHLCTLNTTGLPPPLAGLATLGSHSAVVVVV